MSQCKIYLENYNGAYYPSNEIRGRLECYFNDEVNARAIKIRLKCQERNEWTGSEEVRNSSDNQQTSTRYVTYTGEHDVLYIEQTLFGSGSSTQRLPQGRHVYPFSYVLPDIIPSTFSGPHGSISYQLKGIVDIPMGFDYEDKFIFVVISPIDFNKMPKDLQEIRNYSDEKTVCCWCCQGGNVTMDVELPKRAFTIGEVINFTITISNMSNSNVEDLRVKLTKTTTYKVTSPTTESKTEVEELVTIKEHGVGAHGEHTYNLQLAIPQHIVVPNFVQCNLFETNFSLTMSCEMPSCTLDLDIAVPDVQLGHIQWNEGYNQTPQGGSITPGFINSLPPIDGVYPPSVPSNLYPYPPSSVPNYPKSMGFAVPEGQPSAPPFGANISFGDSKAREASFGGPSAPTAADTELLPPSYNEVQQGTNNFHRPA